METFDLSPKEQRAFRSSVPLELLRHKMLMEIAKERRYPSISIDDVNECLITAGLPIIVPDEVYAQELKIIKAEKEESEE